MSAENAYDILHCIAKINGLEDNLVLDEPTNHIDINTKELLEEALKEFQGTVIFISHDRYFINKLANKILYIEDKRIKEYVGNYDDYKMSIKI